MNPAYRFGEKLAMSDGRTIAAITGAMAVPGATVGAVIGHIASLRAQGAEQGWPVDEHGMTSIKMDDGRALRATGRGAAIGAVAGPSLMAGAVLAGHLMRKRADAPHSYYGEVLRMRPGEVLRPIGKGALGGALAGGVYDLWKQHGREGNFDYKQLAKHMGVGGAIGAGIGAIPGARRGHQIAKEQSILDGAGAFSAHASQTMHQPVYSLNDLTAKQEDIGPVAAAMIHAAGDPSYLNPGESLRVGTRGLIAVHGRESARDKQLLISIANAPRDPAERARWVTRARYQAGGHADRHNFAAEADNPLMHRWDNIHPDHDKTWRSIIDSMA